MTLKIIAISVLALLLLIPLGMIGSKIYEREMFRDEARRSIAESWTGEQLVFTPMLLQPYVIQETVRKRDKDTNDETYENVEHRRHLMIVPDTLITEAEVETEKRKRGIYAIPVYTANMTISGEFTNKLLENEKNKIAATNNFLRLETPSLILVVSDSRGILGSPNIEINGERFDFEPGSSLSHVPAGLHTRLKGNEESISFHTSLTLRGMESLKLVPIGLDSTVTMLSPWPHPEFFGAFLPVTHDINDKGFTANWRTNQFSTDIQQNVKICGIGNCDALSISAFGVRFIDGVDVYLQSERATKYGILFIGLSFITFFIFETLKNLRIHPIQYTLVGMGIAVFYLLLVSLGEHVNFGVAYFIAASACIALLSYYVRYVLGNWKSASLFTGLYVFLFGILFVIIQAEDFAMLMGAILIFSVLSTIMIVTRNFDWYSLGTLQDAIKKGKSKLNMADRERNESA